MCPLVFLYGAAASYPNYIEAVRESGGEVCDSLKLSDASACGGLLLPGGGDLDPALYGQSDRGSQPPDRERDAAELELARRFALAGKPILGICRGLQVLNVAFGGTLVQDLGGHSRQDGADRLHAVTALPGSVLACLCGERFTVNSAHHQAADRMGENLIPVCWAEDGTVEALVHASLPVLGVQWHPERLTGRFRRPEAPWGRAVFSLFLSRFGE